MGNKQLLLLTLAVIIVGIMIVAGISLFRSYERQNHIDTIIKDLNTLAAIGYQYVIRPVAMGGGGGDFRPETIEGETIEVSGGPKGALGFKAFFNSLPPEILETDYAIYEFDSSVDNVDHGGYHYHEHGWINTVHPQIIIKGTSKLHTVDDEPLVRYIALRKDGKVKIGKTNFDYTEDEAIMRP
jgi:hypothetical protein